MTIWSSLDIWWSSIDDLHGRAYRPWETSLIKSSIIVHGTFFLLLGWFLVHLALLALDDTFGRTGVRTNLLLPYHFLFPWVSLFFFFLRGFFSSSSFLFQFLQIFFFFRFEFYVAKKSPCQQSELEPQRLEMLLSSILSNIC